MKKLLTLIVIFCIAAVADEPVSALKLLSIGNSFSVNAHRYLGEIIKQHGKATAVLGNAAIGGCSFKRHWEEHLKSEADPKHKPYRYKGKPMSLRDYLTAEKWDVVTIQSVSHQSYKPELWQPYADNLVALIKELAPQAKIYIHRTWAYRPDNFRFFGPKKNNFSAQLMYEQSGAAYKALSEKYNAPMIPSGEALWTAFQEQPVKNVSPDPNFDYKNPVHPNLPKDDGALIKGYYWKKDPKTQEWNFTFDGIHANTRGEYLLGCTWYAYFFKQNLDDLAWQPKDVTPEDAKFLRSIAQRVAAQAAK